MVRCPDCETPNSVDSKFCKFCGAALPEGERMDAQVKLNEMVAEGYRLFNDNRTDEALLIADSALGSSPNDLRALSLKGMCLERQGHLTEALESYERVVELSPDSPLDKIKVTHVRNILAARAIEVPPPNRRGAWIGAIAAVVFVVAVGAIFASAAGGAKAPTTVAAKSDTPDGSTVATFQPPSAAPQTNPQPGTNAESKTNGASPPTLGSGGPPAGGLQWPPALRDQIPGTTSESFRPVGVVGVPTTPGPSPTPGPVPAPGGGAANTASPGGGDPVPTVEDTTPREPPAVYEIKVHNSGGGSAGGSDNTDSGGQLAALLQAGANQFSTANYAAAAKTYERALRAGGDPAAVNQRIGQSYAHLGRSSEAINAYVKAVNAYQAAISRKDTPSLRAGLASCQRALKVLKGE